MLVLDRIEAYNIQADLQRLAGDLHECRSVGRRAGMFGEIVTTASDRIG